MPSRREGREGWAIVSLEEQLYAFVLTIVGGIAMGVLFDMFRVVRSGVGPRGGAARMLDVLYWVLATPMMLGLLWRANHGELRFYVVLGVGVGSLLYHAMCSVYAVELFSALWYGAGRTLSWIVDGVVFLITWPVVAIRRLVLAHGKWRPGKGGRRSPWRPWRSVPAWRRR